MFLTRKVLEQFKACEKGIEWFDKNYPQGAELMEVMSHPELIPNEMFEWAYSHFSLSDEEKARYQEICQINNSMNVVKSRNVADSEYIIKSQDIKESKFIFNSKKIKQSQIVNGSTQVNNSTQIYDSKMIYDSSQIFESNTIRTSSNIVKSEYIINSHDIIQSAMITNGAYLIGCKETTDSAFGLELNKCNHCLFCTELTNTQYYIFNHEVPKEQFDSIYEIFKDMEIAPLAMLTFNDPRSLDPFCQFSINTIRQFAPVLTDEVIEWIKTLPYYDENIVTKLTFTYI